MWKNILIFSCLFGFGCTRIDPGHVGIKIDMSGSSKGVNEIPLVTGWQMFIPGMTQVLEYPTYVQTAKWENTKDYNEEISFSSKEGMTITSDISLSYQIENGKIPYFYVKFRSDDLGKFTHGFLRNVARDAFNEESVQYSVEEIYGSKKEAFLTGVKNRVNNQVKDIGVSLQQFGFIGAPRLPDNVVQSINSKIKATQDAIRVENELRSVQAEAMKVVAQAEGKAKANIALTNSLSPNLIQWRQLELQQQALEKWNGALPTYTGNAPLPFISVK